MPGIHAEVKKLTEAFIRFSVRLDSQVDTILTDIGRLTARFEALEEKRTVDREQINNICRCLDNLQGLPDKLDAIENDVESMKPWVRGMQWALRIGGAILVTATVMAILWAITQSGAGLP